MIGPVWRLIRPWLFAVCLVLVFSEVGMAATYFNSSETGCDGSDSNVKLCDDGEHGGLVWTAQTDRTADANNNGWLTAYFSAGCGGTCTDGQSITDPSSQHFLRSGAGVSGSTSLSQGPHTGNQGQAYLDLWHHLNGAGSTASSGFSTIYIRYYWKALSVCMAQEKWLIVNDPPNTQAGIFVAQWFKFGTAGIQCNNPPWTPTMNVTQNDQNLTCNIAACSFDSDKWYFIEHRITLNPTPADPTGGQWQLWSDDCGVNGDSCPGSPTLRADHSSVLWLNTGCGAACTARSIGNLNFSGWSVEVLSGGGPGPLGSTGEELYDLIKVSSVGPIGFAGSSPPPPPPSIISRMSPGKVMRGFILTAAVLIVLLRIRVMVG